MSGHHRHAEATSSSTFSILPSPHPSCWRNSQPSPQVARLPRPAEHVFSSPDQVRLRSSIHPQWSSGSSSPACTLVVRHSLATDDEFHSDDRSVDKGRQNMERHPLPCLQTHRFPACLQLNQRRANLKWGMASPAPQMFELWPQSYEFSFKTQRNQRKTVLKQCRQDSHVSKISITSGKPGFQPHGCLVLFL